MQLNKLGHGLAISAVSALVISGLAIASPATAAPGDGVRMLSQENGLASVRRDAGMPFGTGITLTAERLDAGSTISFEYNADPAATAASGGWTPIAPAPTQTGAFAAVEWAPDQALVGTTIALRAVATPPTGSPTYSTRNNVVLSGQESPTHSVTSAGTPFASSATGPFFVQPYADSGRTARLLPVRGSTSATEGTVELSAWNSQSGRFEGTVGAAVSTSELKTSFGSGTTTSIDGGEFTGVLDITPFDVSSGDTLAVRALLDTDSVMPTRLTQQTIGAIRIDGTPVTRRAGTTVTVMVEDPNGYPVAGAEVRSTATPSRATYTNGDGLATFVQANESTDSYYVNTTDTDAYQNGVDLVTNSVVAPAFGATAAATVARFADGTVFDDREYAAGDIALQVVDTDGEPFPGARQISYALYRRGDQVPPLTPVTTDTDGRSVVPFDPAGPDGVYVLKFAGPDGTSTKVVFTAGDAVLGLTPLKGTGPSGGTITYAGSLTVAGKPLSGRVIDLTYVRGIEQAPGVAADAGLGSDRALTAETTTRADGSFTVDVNDLAEAGNPAETGGALGVSARGLGDVLQATTDFVASPAAPTPPTTTPTPDLPTPRLTLKGSSTGSKDRLRVTGPASAAGAELKVFAKVGKKWRVVKKAKLDRKGDATIKVRDRNGSKSTRYYVELLGNSTVAGTTTKVVRTR